MSDRLLNTDIARLFLAALLAHEANATSGTTPMTSTDESLAV